MSYADGMRRLRIMLAAIGLSAAAVVPITALTAGPVSATCYSGRAYSGYVLHKSGNNLYIWNPNTGCENWVYASLAWTCGQYEWYNGSSCPAPGGGGGGSW